MCGGIIESGSIERDALKKERRIKVNRVLRGRKGGEGFIDYWVVGMDGEKGGG